MQLIFRGRNNEMMAVDVNGSVAPTQPTTQAPITVVLNWQADLKR